MKIQLGTFHTFGTLSFSGVGSKELHFKDLATAKLAAEILAELMISTPKIVHMRGFTPREKQAEVKEATVQ